jgi:hypothetical protein
MREVGNLAITLDKTNPGVAFQPPNGNGMVLRLIDWLDAETMLLSMPDAERKPFQLTLMLRMGEWQEPFPGIRMKLYDPRGRVAIEASREIKISRLSKS